MHNTIRNEYPRPEMTRKNWINLNGEWDFAFDFANTLLEKHPLTEDTREISYHICHEFPEKIFCRFVRKVNFQESDIKSLSVLAGIEKKYLWQKMRVRDGCCILKRHIIQLMCL